MGVKYSFPSNLQLSKDCVDLISKVFVGNPANRINIAGIRMHPWFLKNLPEELKVLHCTAMRTGVPDGNSQHQASLVVMGCCHPSGRLCAVALTEAAFSRSAQHKH